MVNLERLAEVGPIDPLTGFPLWYKDGNGVRLELVWQQNDQFAPAVGEVPVIPAPVGLPADFPDESFYMLVEASLVIGGGSEPGEARVVLALEATFGGNEAVVDGQQIVFGRIRFRVRDGVPFSDYTLTHPYGTVNARTDDRGRVTATQDIGVSPLAFDQALAGEVAPFLSWTTDSQLPPGYIGDGTTAHQITGSPFGTNFALVEGPGVGTAGGRPDPDDPGNTDKVYTDLFVLQGKLATKVGVDIRRAEYSRQPDDSVTVEVFARSEPGQTLAVSGTDVTQMALDGGAEGNYFGRTVASAIPTGVTVTNVGENWSQTEQVTDLVTIADAVFDGAAGTLTVTANSSDQGTTPPSLTVSGRGIPANSVPGSSLPMGAPPSEIVVSSTAGGAASGLVRVT